MNSSRSTSGIRLSELTSRIEDIIKQTFRQRYWVIADVSNHRFKAAGKWHFFELVECGDRDGEVLAKVDAVAWKGGQERIARFERETGEQFKSGVNVLVSVSVDYHRVHGLRLTLHDISPEYTLGKLKQQKEAVLRRLLTECANYVRKEGDLFVTRNRELAMPLVIQRVALVGAPGTAGFGDFIHTLAKNEYGFHFKWDTYDCKVQGEGGAEQLRARLIDVFNSQILYDVVVILRGGGSQTDLLMFDQFIVGQIVAKFPIPIITGIGHQRDETIADLMAHTATKTPTKAAEFIVSRNHAFESDLENLQKNLVIQTQRLLTAHGTALTGFNSKVVNSARTTLALKKDEIAAHNRKVVQRATALIHAHARAIERIAHQVISRPIAIVSVRHAELKSAIERLRTGGNGFLRNSRGYLGHFVKVIQLADPKNVLARGFAIVKVGNKIIIDLPEVSPRERIQVIGASGQLTAKVEKSQK